MRVLVQLKHNDKFKIGSLDVTALHTPCHTQDHICYFVEDKAKDQRYVFTGYASSTQTFFSLPKMPGTDGQAGLVSDTLFISGCGRFFEGTGQEMDLALNTRLAALPHDTIVACGHEYTKVGAPLLLEPRAIPTRC